MAAHLLVVFCAVLGGAELITLGVLASLRRARRQPAHARGVDEQRLQRLLEVARSSQ